MSGGQATLNFTTQCLQGTCFHVFGCFPVKENFNSEHGFIPFTGCMSSIVNTSPFSVNSVCGRFLCISAVYLWSSLPAGAVPGPVLLSTGLSGRYATFLWMKVTKAVAVPAPLFSTHARRRCGRIKLPPAASVPRPVCHGADASPFSAHPFALLAGVLQAAFAA